MESKAFFTKQLLEWSKEVDRPMPWKGERNPYLIWLSEIILQQTRVEQGLAYFLRFKTTFPTVQDLAKASQDEVFKLWEGLGYYSRARNLHATAKRIVDDFDGVFPTAYKDILSLKGVGPYTAAAIASFAYDLPYAVVDGNVYRVLTRFFGIETPIDSTLGKKDISALAQELLDKKQAAKYNQAIMDFGATQCVPKSPNCKVCPLKNRCVALKDNLVNILPIKSKKLKKRDRFFNYLVIEQDEYTFIQKRTAKDIWQDLYQFPMIESDQIIEREILVESEAWKQIFNEQIPTITSKSTIYKQTLSHQKINAIFWKIILDSKTDLNVENWIKTSDKDILSYAFPKIIDMYLKDRVLVLF